jgi:hypothetical protein
MKNKALVVLIFILGIINGVYGQNLKKSQFTTFSYIFETDETVIKALKPYVNFIKLKQNNDESKVQGVLVHTLFKLISKKMEDSLSSYIMPAKSFVDKATYNEFGFPDLSIQKAIRYGDTKFFLKIIASISNEIYDLKGEKYPIGSIVPKVHLKLEIYNKYGYVPIFIAEGDGSAYKPVKLSADYLAGMDFMDSKLIKPEGEEVLFDLFNRAAIEAIVKLKYNRK